MIDENEKLVLGIDEAGRGSVIGPLVIGGVLMQKNKIRFLTRVGVKDSKKLTMKKRMALSRKIKKISEFCTVTIHADEIDKMRLQGTNLNQIETNGMNEIVQKMNSDICYIDCIDINEERFHDNMQKVNPDVEFITKHKADDTYNIVSAASIIAKVERDKQLAIIRNEYGELGSGYPSDKVTINFLKNIKNDEYPPIVRTTWNTVKNLKEK